MAEPPNAIVQYADAETGEVLGVCAFYDPGLDPKSSYWKDQYRIGRRFQPVMAYGCGMPLQEKR